MEDRVTLSFILRKDPPRNETKTTKSQLQPESPHKWHKPIPRASSSGDQGDCTTESHRTPTIQDHTTNLGSQNKPTWEAEANKKCLTNKRKTKKQPSIKRKGGIFRRSAKWNRGKSTIRYWVLNNCYLEAQWARWELSKTAGKLRGTYCKLYQHEKGRNCQQEPSKTEEYNFWTEEHRRRN